MKRIEWSQVAGCFGVLCFCLLVWAVVIVLALGFIERRYG